MLNQFYKWLLLTLMAIITPVWADTTIPVSTEPVHLALSSDNRNVYVAHACLLNQPDECGGPIEVIDTTQQAVVKVINSYKAAVLAVNRSNSVLYGAANNIIYALNTADNTERWHITRTPTQTRLPQAMLLSPDNAVLYVLETEATVTTPATELLVIDTNTGHIKTSFAVSGGEALAISHDGKYLYVTASDYHLNSQLITLNTNCLGGACHTIASTLNLPGATQLRAIALDPTEQWLYMAGLGMNSGVFYSVHLATAEIKTTPMTAWPQGLTLSPDGKLAYITDFSGNSLLTFVLSTQTVINKQPISMPQDIVLNPATALAYVASLADTVQVVPVSTNC